MKLGKVDYYHSNSFYHINEHPDWPISSNKRLKESLIDGIPDELRGKIWKFLWKAPHHKAGAEEGMSTHTTFSIDLGLYETLWSQDPDESYKSVIEKDLPRTHSKDMSQVGQPL